MPHTENSLNKLAHLIDSETLEHELEQTIRQYQNQRLPSLAQTALHYIEALCSHPFFHGSDEQRCRYHRVARHWRHLAGEELKIIW